MKQEGADKVYNDLNLRIANVENFVNGYIRKLMVDNSPFTWSGLETAMDNNRGEDSFIKFVKDLVDRRRDITESTRKNTGNSIRRL